MKWTIIGFKLLPGGVGVGTLWEGLRREKNGQGLKRVFWVGVLDSAKSNPDRYAPTHSDYIGARNDYESGRWPVQVPAV